MKRILVTAALAIAASSLALGQTQGERAGDDSKAEQEIAQLMRQLEEAHRRGDAAFFDRVYANEFSAITPSGEVVSRTAVLQMWKSGTLKYESYDYDDVGVRVYEDAAVVTNRLTRKGRIKGQEASGQFRQTRVFVKRDGNWQLVATQVTGLASPATSTSKPPESSAHNAETTDDIQQILRLTRERDEAAGRGDGAALAALVDERFSFVSPRGRLLDKKRYVANRTKGISTMEGMSVRHENVDVRLYGDTAVATSRNISTGRAVDGDFSGEWRETDTWIKRDGKWKLVALHLSPINYTGAHTAEITRPLKITGAEELTWAASANVPGQLEAALDGSSYNGPYVLRVRRPDGQFDPPHMYETDEELTVLSGTLRIGSGEHPERAKAQAVHAGGHVVIPARMPFYSWAEGETITEAFWAGPAYPKYLGATDNKPAASVPEAQYQEATVTLHGLSFHYLEWPNQGAPAMLLIPGTCGGGGCAQGETPFASAMRDHYHIYAMEQRGQCDSEWAKEYAWQRVVEDIDAFVDKLHLAPVTIVGGSSGAVWGYLYAAQHPDKVARLVAVEGGGNLPKTRTEPQQRSTTAAPHVTFASPEEAVTYAKTRWHTDPSVDAAVHDWILHGIRKLDDGRWGWRQDPAAVTATDQFMFLPTRDELDAALLRVKCPTLIVRGSESAFSREIAEKRAHAIPNGSWAEVPNAGHVVLLANPAGFLAVVREFLVGNSNPAPRSMNGGTSQASQAQLEVLQAENERVQAVLHNDFAALDRLMRKEFIVTDAQGRVHDKADEVSLYRDGRRQTQSWEPSDFKVRVYGDAAVVTERAAVKDVLEGERRDVQIRLTHVWVKRDGRWQVVARHATRMAEPQQNTTTTTTSQSGTPSSAPHIERGGTAEPPPRSKAEEEIYAHRDQMRQAFLRGDIATIDRGWAGDFIQITSWGEVRTKTQILQAIRSGERKTLSLDYADRKLRVYGDVAVETGQVQGKMLSGGRETGGAPQRFTLVLLRGPQGWQAVSNQVSNIAPPSAENPAPLDGSNPGIAKDEPRAAVVSSSPAVAAPTSTVQVQGEKSARIREAPRIARLGMLSDSESFGNPISPSNWLAAFRAGLRDAGYIEEKNILLKFRNGNRDPEKLVKYAAELVDMKVDTIVASSTTAAKAAKASTHTIPIIFWGAEPLSSGLVHNLDHPGENLTGVTANEEQQAKFLAMLKEVVPGLNRVAILFNPDYAPVPGLLKYAESGARALGLSPQLVKVTAPDELPGAFAAMKREGCHAALVLNHGMFFREREELAALAIENRIALSTPYLRNAEAGALIAHEPDFDQVWHLVASYVGKILKGTSPGDLPVQRLAAFRYAINLKTAKALGLTIPQSVLNRTSVVIPDSAPARN